MYYHRLLRTITALVTLAGVLVGVGQISATPVEAAPPCNAFTVNAASLTALCSAQPVSELSASERYFAQQAQELMRAHQANFKPLNATGLSTSEAYYAQKAALGQPSYSVTYGSAEWTAALRESAALAQQPDSFPTTGGSGDLTSGAAPAPAAGRGPYASPQAAPVSTSRQMSYGPPGR